MLFASGADASGRDRSGWTALHWASHEFASYGETVKLLLDAGADPMLITRMAGPLLMSAVIHRSPKSISALLDAGALVNTRNVLGETALKELVIAKRPNFFDRLIH